MILKDESIYIDKNDGSEWKLSFIWWGSPLHSYWELYKSPERYKQLSEEKNEYNINLHMSLN
jgi:hypothetical protein